jgi:hypothetical protein
VCGAAGDPANGQPARLVARYEERPGLDAADLEPVVEGVAAPGRGPVRLARRVGILGRGAKRTVKTFSSSPTRTSRLSLSS